MRPPDFRCLPEAGVRPIPDLESCARTSEAVPLGTHQSHRAHPAPIPHCRNAMNAAANGTFHNDSTSSITVLVHSTLGSLAYSSFRVVRWALGGVQRG